MCVKSITLRDALSFFLTTKRTPGNKLAFPNVAVCINGGKVFVGRVCLSPDPFTADFAPFGLPTRLLVPRLAPSRRHEPGA